jgi:hypothetical protein
MMNEMNDKNEFANQLLDSFRLAFGVPKIDWRQYFLDFCAAHGPLEPVEYGAGLLFSDGWRWANCRSYCAEELPPPADPVAAAALRRHYWSERKKVCLSLKSLGDKVRANADAIARARSLPLCYGDGDPDGASEGEQSWDEWLEEHLSRCERELNQLTIGGASYAVDPGTNAGGARISALGRAAERI